MHKVIYLVVKGKDEKKAWANADILRDKLTDGNSTFHYDYGTFFNDVNATMSGQARWGKIIPISKLDNSIGQQLLKDAFTKVENQFNRSIEQIKMFVNDYTTQELYTGKITDTKSKIIEGLKDKSINLANSVYMFRYYLKECSDNKSYGWIYYLDNDYVGGFDNLDEFNLMLQESYNQLWILPMDVHF